ncbi:MAG TPA: TonB family protein [Gemmatimonadaceae bacterium]|nr:TonB family protein [Gemmatimonadaceae bacterium]
MRRLCGVAAIGLAGGALALTPASLRAQQPSARGTVAGMVRDSSGAGIAGAEITIVGTNLRAHTNAQGEFRLTNVPAGTLTVGVRRLGFIPTVASIAIAANEAAAMSVIVTPLAQSLAAVIVRGNRRFDEHGRLAGFYQRRSRSSGGHFITREQIDQRNPSQVTDLFRSVPGARIYSSTFSNVVRFRGMRCAPLVWLDGFPATAGEFDLDALDPYIIEGIEVYLGVATVPPEFRWVRGGGSCGAIVIWTGFEERRRKARRAAAPPAELTKQVEERQLFTADQVDHVARPDSSSTVRPAYPDSLFRERVTGQVLVEFVVDTGGLVVLESISAISTSHALFTDAVRRALQNARFHPALLGGQRVRQLVQLPVKFEMPVETSQKP